MNGIIGANGGTGGTGSSPASGACSYGGGGAGGSIRLAAARIIGSGTLTARGGLAVITSLFGGNGVIRLEAGIKDEFTGSITLPESMGSPVRTFFPTSGLPSVKVMSVN